jgi:hypothetical protein
LGGTLVKRLERFFLPGPWQSLGISMVEQELRAVEECPGEVLRAWQAAVAWLGKIGEAMTAKC